MKDQRISYTNKKGQLVIPKDFRDKMKISDSVALSLRYTGKSIVISPVKNIETVADSNQSYFDVLSETKGAWGDETKKSESKRKKLKQSERSQVENNKKKW